MKYWNRIKKKQFLLTLKNYKIKKITIKLISSKIPINNKKKIRIQLISNNNINLKYNNQNLILKIMNRKLNYLINL